MNFSYCGHYYGVMSMLSLLKLNPLRSFSFADVGNPAEMADTGSLLAHSEAKRKSAKWSDPKIVAFDLDCTLWPFWVDTHVDPPFHKDEHGQVIDKRGRLVQYIESVPEVLNELHKRGLQLAAISRTSETKGANQLLDLFDIRKYFTFTEIYPGSKILHFSKLKRETNIDYSDMLFFDDEFRNIADAKKLGIYTIYCPDGITPQIVDNALLDFDKSKR